MSPTIIPQLSDKLFRNFPVFCSATFRYCATHFVKNALISSSGILIPHLSGSFLVIFPKGLQALLWTASRSFIGVAIIACVFACRSAAISGASSFRPFQAASQTSLSHILPLR